MSVLSSAETAMASSPKADPQQRIEALLLLAKAANSTGDSANAKVHAGSGVAQLSALRNPPQSLQRLADEVTPIAAQAKR